MISYATVQRSLATRLHQRLTDCECNPKLDHLDLRSGERWRQTLGWWLSTCRTAVVLLSKEALESAWVRYELNVLAHREQTGRNVRLVLVHLGVSRRDVEQMPELGPCQLADIQSHYEFPDADLDDDALTALANDVHELAGIDDPPIDRLVSRVCDHIRDVAPGSVDAAWNNLDVPDDPWLIDPDDEQRRFARAYCSTPVSQTYDALQALAGDAHLTGETMNDLIDLNVMTTFDTKAVADLHHVGQQQGRRALVSATTQAGLAEVATQAAYDVHGGRRPFRFVLNIPITGVTAADIAAGLAEDLRRAIRTFAKEDVDDWLAFTVRRRHPVFAILTSAVGITAEVLHELHELFPSVVFVVLSSTTQTMPSLSRELGLAGIGVDTEDLTAWGHYVEHEQELAAERTLLRQDLVRVQRADGP